VYKNKKVYLNLVGHSYKNIRNTMGGLFPLSLFRGKWKRDFKDFTSIHERCTRCSMGHVHYLFL